jgi:flagellar biosynthesis chaperone FliJ
MHEIRSASNRLKPALQTGVLGNAMTVILQKLIEALRNELEQYGEMLALLEQQQEAAGLGADVVMHTIASINAQGATIDYARAQRKRCQRDLSEDICQPHDSSFAHLIPLMPPNYQPLLKALVQENNELLVRVRERAQQNQALLRRSVDFMQRFITTLSSEETRHLHATNILTVDPNPPVYDAIA